MPSALEQRGPIAPPFDFNDAAVSRFSPEVTGRMLLNSLCHRLGWPSLAGKRVLDFGCGVRFARTIFNLEIEIGLYAGVDTDAAPIAWLNENAADPRFRFEHLDMHNAMYNPNGGAVGAGTLQDMGLDAFDAACMFSVITHQEPRDAELIFSMLRPCAERLYFTALVDDGVDGYVEKDPERPRNMSAYSPALIGDRVTRAGWLIDNVYPPARFQQTAFVCRRN
jgi:SAM-dependent methyltransferase